MNKHFYLVSLLVVAGLTACSSGDDEPTQAPTPERKITIEVSENPLTDGSADGARSTRGTIITTASLNEFHMNYQESPYSATKTGNEWSTMPSIWPGVGNDDKIFFYAYNGGVYYYGGGDPYVSFTVDELASNQKDFLVAQTAPTAYNDDRGKVRLTFDHACAAIDFKFQITNALAENLEGNNLTVSSLVLKNVIKKGEYHYSSKAWSLLSEKSYYTLTNSEKTITTTASTVSDTGTMFIIPQTLDSDACMEIAYGGKTATVSLAGATWEAGKHYDVTIRLGTTTIK